MIFALFLTMGSCIKLKKDTIHFRGQVINIVSKAPVQGAQITLDYLDRPTSVGLNLGSQSDIAVAFTNKDGYYDLETENKHYNDADDVYRLRGLGSASGVYGEFNVMEAQEKGVLNLGTTEVYKNGVIRYTVHLAGSWKADDIILVKMKSEGAEGERQ